MERVLAGLGAALPPHLGEVLADAYDDLDPLLKESESLREIRDLVFVKMVEVMVQEDAPKDFTDLIDQTCLLAKERVLDLFPAKLTVKQRDASLQVVDLVREHIWETFRRNIPLSERVGVVPRADSAAAERPEPQKHYLAVKCGPWSGRSYLERRCRTPGGLRREGGSIDIVAGFDPNPDYNRGGWACVIKVTSPSGRAQYWADRVGLKFQIGYTLHPTYTDAMAAFEPGGSMSL